MLRDFNEGRSKRYYCIAATILEIQEMRKVLDDAKERTEDLAMREKSRFLHSLIDSVAKRKNYRLKLRR